MSHLLPDPVNDVYGKPITNCPQYILQHKTTEQNDDDCLNNEKTEEVTIANRYENHRSKFLEMLEQFGSIREHYYGWITAPRHRIGLIFDNCRTCEKRTLPRWISRQTISHSQNQPDIKRNHQRTRHSRVGNRNLSRTEKGRFAFIMCQVSRSKCCNCQGVLSTSTNGRVIRLAKRSTHLFNLGYKLRLLKNEDWRPRPRKDRNYQS